MIIKFVEYNNPVALIDKNKQELDSYKIEIKPNKEKCKSKITKKAIQLAQQVGIDITAIDIDGIITEKHILKMINQESPAGKSKEIIMHPGVSPAGINRVLVLGGGYGAMQVIDILLHNPFVKVVGILDDNADLIGTEIFSVKILGKTENIGQLLKENFFDQAIVSISTDINIRKTLYDECKKLNIPMANAICPTVRINREVFIGEGNVICSMVHIGTCTYIGNNNFISSLNSIEHHNVWGSHIATGPNCATSSRVKVGDSVKFGTGICIQPGVSIGDNCLIASGSIITRSIPKRHALKTKINYEIKSINRK